MSNSIFTTESNLTSWKLVFANVYGIIATEKEFSLEDTIVKLTPFIQIDPLLTVMLLEFWYLKVKT